MTLREESYRQQAKDACAAVRLLSEAYAFVRTFEPSVQRANALSCIATLASVSCLDIDFAASPVTTFQDAEAGLRIAFNYIRGRTGRGSQARLESKRWHGAARGALERLRQHVTAKQPVPNQEQTDRPSTEGPRTMTAEQQQALARRRETIQTYAAAIVDLHQTEALVIATDILKFIAAVELPPNAPPAWSRTVETARRGLAAMTTEKPLVQLVPSMPTGL